MATMLARIKVNDFDEWKSMFDSDPARAREHATGYRILRGAEDANEIFISVEFPSAEAAGEARKRLLEYGVLDRVPEVLYGPTVAEEADVAVLSAS